MNDTEGRDSYSRFMDRTRREHTMKRIAIILGVAATVGVSPSVAAGGNISAQVESQVVRQIVESQVVASQLVESQVVRQVVRPGLVRSALVRPALVKPSIFKSHQASAARVARIHVLGRSFLLPPIHPRKPRGTARFLSVRWSTHLERTRGVGDQTVCGVVTRAAGSRAAGAIP